MPLLATVAACGGGFERGAPLPDAPEISQRARAASAVEEPAHVLFEWEYVDRRGSLRGEGAGRVNPPDHFRLDLFTSGEGSLSAALVDAEIAHTGDLEDIELPPPTFLYAMTGLFRPGPGPPIEGFESGELRVLGYGTGDGAVRHFYLEGDRLVRVEERRGGRLERRIELAWGEDPRWPAEARYRDDTVPSRARWELLRVRPQPERWPADIYEIP